MTLTGRVIGRSDRLRQRGDHPGRRTHHDQAGGQRRGRAQPAKAADGGAAERGKPVPECAQHRENLEEKPGDRTAGRVHGPHRRDGRRPVRGPRRSPGLDLGANAIESVVGGIHRIGCGVQSAPQRLIEGRLSWIRAPVRHVSRSSTVRNAAIALEVWLLTAPRVMPMAAAICASDRSP